MKTKLVRDKVPALMVADAGRPMQVTVLTPPEYKRALLDKLLEEAAELRDAVHNFRHPDAVREEFADVVEVLNALVELFTPGDEKSNEEDWLRNAVQKKADEKGQFRSRLSVRFPEGDECIIPPLGEVKGGL
jgi:predicted house-cleaning noncanonical NTP pyrophosphatase (MazG superfamily)